jgi:hypothetical protein
MSALRAGAAFYQTTVELGGSRPSHDLRGVRLWPHAGESNSDGSDHGWGNMHFLLGGQVQGKSYVGTAPTLA